MAVVLGYHGCKRQFAEKVRSGQIDVVQWQPSQNEYDWLGKGIYFWEDSRTRAEQWSIKRFGDDADVLVARIELGRCLDLLENTYHDAIRATYRNLQSVYKNQGWTLPKNKKAQHNLDCLVINKFVNFMERFEGQRGIVFQSVRAVFEEGRRIFPGSAIRAQSHIQIAVRDVQCILLEEISGGE